jgi:hypothetical protein
MAHAHNDGEEREARDDKRDYGYCYGLAGNVNSGPDFLADLVTSLAGH